MVKKARHSNPKRIKDLKRKIDTNEYLQLAISRIAWLLTTELLGI